MSIKNVKDLYLYHFYICYEFVDFFDFINSNKKYTSKISAISTLTLYQLMFLIAFRKSSYSYLINLSVDLIYYIVLVFFIFNNIIFFNIKIDSIFLELEKKTNFFKFFARFTFFFYILICIILYFI